MSKGHKKYKYVFLFKKRGKFEELDLHGKSIKDFWHDIYDMFDLKGDMVVQKLNGQEFTIKEIKQLFRDLLEDMMDDFSVIALNIPNLRTLEFINYGDEHLEPLQKNLDKKIEEKGIDVSEDEAAFEEALEKAGLSDENCEKLTKDLSYKNLKKALDRLNELELNKIIEGFNIKHPLLLNKKKFSGIKYCLINFNKAKEDNPNRFYYFYNIIDKARKSGIYNRLLETAKLKKKTNGIRKIMNYLPVKGSRHEGNHNKLRNPTKEEIALCEITLKKLIMAWINESKINE